MLFGTFRRPRREKERVGNVPGQNFEERTKGRRTKRDKEDEGKRKVEREVSTRTDKKKKNDGTYHL